MMKIIKLFYITPMFRSKKDWKVHWALDWFSYLSLLLVTSSNALKNLLSSVN